MTSSNDRSTSTPAHLDHSTSSMSPQDQRFLQALHQFILPHIGAEVHNRTGMKESFRGPGPEAMNLVIAVKEFISSVVKDSSEAKSKSATTIEVSLDDEDRSSESAEGVDVYTDVQDSEYAGVQKRYLSRNPIRLRVAHSVRLSGIMHDDLNSNTLGVAETSSRDESSALALPDSSSFHEHVLRGLREHVFNKMPIRLLRIAPLGSRLQISLVEKEGMYSHLVSILEEHMDDPDYQPQRHEWEYRLETYNEAVTRLIGKYAGYAILSHTWLRASPGEVTYADWTRGLFNEHSSGYQKLVHFCKVAWMNHGLTLGWMDTVCINKESSSELDESIRSMYKWYQRSTVCIVHLATTQTLSHIHRDPWFTRGWTLQELLAPIRIKFYNQYWKCFIHPAIDDDKASFTSVKIRVQINKATTLTDKEIKGIAIMPLSRRMQLAAARKVTREEDIAYSLMGLFDVSISTAYGEGSERAFFRLLQEILNSTSWGVLDILNWAGSNSTTIQRTSQILPSSPSNYATAARSSDVALEHIRPLAPLSLTHLGLHIHVLLMPGNLVRDGQVHHDSEPIGHYSAQATIAFKDNMDRKFTTGTFHFLDKKAVVLGEDRTEQRRYTAAVFNVGQGTLGIYIPRRCIAKILYCNYDSDDSSPDQVQSMDSHFFLETEKSVVFDIEYRGPITPHDEDYDDEDGHWIPENELQNHGMQFISLYL